MSHGTHPVDQLLAGDRLPDGWVVTDCVGDGAYVMVTVAHGEERKTYRLPRTQVVEVNR